MASELKDSPTAEVAPELPATKAQTTLQRALSLHQTGHLAQARALYEEILAIQPEHSDALHLFGVIAHQNKNYQRAADLIGEAKNFLPKMPLSTTILDLRCRPSSNPTIPLQIMTMPLR
jgi:tetratricopeptide (TPR) repeat protein